MPHSLSINHIRSQFPILKEQVNGQPLVYLDNAATTQKPLVVIEAINRYYREYNSNVHRGVHHLSQVATDAMEAARLRVKEFINAAEPAEVIFTRGTTESINLVANGLHALGFKAGDQVVVSGLEHHSNIVPWQLATERLGGKVVPIPMDGSGCLDLANLDQILSGRTKLVAVNHISNALGTLNPVEEIIARAHSFEIPVLIDGAQSAPHMPVDVQALDADFYCFSGHKVYGPTGIGVLYGKRKWLEQMPPYQGGGEMIATVSFEKTTFAELPFKFEAGTPNIAGIIGLGAALSWMQETGVDAISKHENKLLKRGAEFLKNLPDVQLYSTDNARRGVLSFNVKGIHPFDLGTLLDKQGVAVRTGHHCAQPVMHALGVPGTVRASLAAYTSEEDLNRFSAALQRAIRMLQ